MRFTACIQVDVGEPVPDIHQSQLDLSYGITQCYLPPDRGDRAAITPARQAGTRFIDPERLEG